MTKVLYIVGSPNPADQSSSRQVAEFMLAELQKKQEDVTVDVRDLYNDTPFILDATYLSALRKMQQQAALTVEESASLAKVGAEVDKFLQYDRYIVSLPLWNFGVPPLLKAYVDNIVVPGKTFRYTAAGPVGLLAGTGKKLVIVQSSGGFYNDGPGLLLNHGSRYLEDIFRFIGIDQINTISLGGTAIPPFDGSRVLAAKAEAAQVLAEIWQPELSLPGSSSQQPLVETSTVLN
ncbi:MAG: FMN-dependent NADH-azoreductase [Deltaproteobacteria bacterium]|nr:FMN-dependent NADH-azoreductase [Deltaproteobacteria bacterium]